MKKILTGIFLMLATPLMAQSEFCQVNFDGVSIVVPTDFQANFVPMNLEPLKSVVVRYRGGRCTLSHENWAPTSAAIGRMMAPLEKNFSTEISIGNAARLEAPSYRSLGGGRTYFLSWLEYDDDARYYTARILNSGTDSYMMSGFCETGARNDSWDVDAQLALAQSQAELLLENMHPAPVADVEECTVNAK